MKANIVVDARGLFCPIPIVKISEALRFLESGGIVELISDDPAIEFDLPAWCRSHGHESELLSRQTGVFRYRVKKSAKTG